MSSLVELQEQIIILKRKIQIKDLEILSLQKKNQILTEEIKRKNNQLIQSEERMNKIIMSNNYCII